MPTLKRRRALWTRTHSLLLPPRGGVGGNAGWRVSSHGPRATLSVASSRSQWWEQCLSLRVWLYHLQARLLVSRKARRDREHMNLKWKCVDCFAKNKNPLNTEGQQLNEEKYATKIYWQMEVDDDCYCDMFYQLLRGKPRIWTPPSHYDMYGTYGISATSNEVSLQMKRRTVTIGSNANASLGSLESQSRSEVTGRWPPNSNCQIANCLLAQLVRSTAMWKKIQLPFFCFLKKFWKRFQ